MACVQARWTTANGPGSLLAEAQQLALEGHFVVEQRMRAQAASLMSFNATACVWRRSEVEAAGGWPESTLTEDLDLAARVLLRGGRFVYLESTAVASLVPTRLLAFQAQQARWARGSMQCARLHTAAVLRARMPLRRKLGTLHHLWHYSIHPLVVALAGVQLALLLQGRTPPYALAMTTGMAIGPLVMYAAARERLHGARGLLGLWRVVPLAVAGLIVTPALAWATCKGLLLRSTGEFVRTPKGDPVA